MKNFIHFHRINSFNQGSFGSDVSINRLGPYDNVVNESTREQFNRPTFGPKPRIPYGISATNRVVQYLF